MVVSRCDRCSTLRRHDHFVSTSTPAPVPSQNAKIDDSCWTKLKAAQVGTQSWWTGSKNPGDYGLSNDPAYPINKAAYDCVQATCQNKIINYTLPSSTGNHGWQVISNKWDGTCDSLTGPLLGV